MRGNKATEGEASVKNGVLRMAFVILAILLELGFILVIVLRFNTYAQWISIVTHVAGAVIVLGIYSQHRSASIKMPWIILVLTAPVLGVTLYLLIGLNASSRRMWKRYLAVDRELLPLLPANDDVSAELRDLHPGAGNLSAYIKKYSGYPLFRDTAVTYYSEASDGLEAQLADLARAERFIFMEYHAIEEKESFGRIRDVLADRAAHGVEVRVFYDDMGSIGFINTDFVKRMEALGIRCRVFNPFSPGLNLFLNNRDHRKITVIDGKVGYTGGYNLANEYFNIDAPYGYWKDTGVRLEGNGVAGLTAAFLEMWHASLKTEEEDRDFARYLPRTEGAPRTEGFVQPYADGPMAREHVAENVYISMAETARDYAWFITPYLIVTEELIHAFGLAAKRGVDVRIITPGIPDKKLIYQVTRSYYNALARNGVRIYEYTPGFCHCKMSVADDLMATCGTINLDYRSLYHHFENGCWLCGGQVPLDIKADFARTMAQCQEVTEEYVTGRGQFLRAGQLILRLVAPLL